MEILPLEKDVGDDGEDTKADAFLYHFELHQIEWSAIPAEAHAVGGYLATILEESYSP